MLGNSRMGNLMVKEHSPLEKVNHKETSMLENLKKEKGMVREHTFSMMGKSMLGNSRMGKEMVREDSLDLMERSI